MQNHNCFSGIRAWTRSNAAYTPRLVLILISILWDTYVRRVRDQFTDEYLLVRVEGVDDQAHQLSDLGLEGEGFNFIGVHHGYVCWHILRRPYLRERDSTEPSPIVATRRKGARRYTVRGGIQARNIRPARDELQRPNHRN